MRAILYTVLLYLISYGVMTALSKMEDRRVRLPIWNVQYKSFFPGDLFLWGGMGLIIDIYVARHLSQPSWRPFAGAILGLTVGLLLFVAQFTDEEKEHVDAMWIWAAPTRVWHQIFIWSGGVTLVAMFFVPVILSGEFSGTPAWSASALLLAYGGCVVYDLVHPPKLPAGSLIHAPLKERYRARWLARLVHLLYPYKKKTYG